MAISEYASERDFVANYLLPELKEAAKEIGILDSIEFHVEKPVNGIADLTAEKSGKRLFLIEAKFKRKGGNIERNIEPRDPEVVKQAASYAMMGGYPYYATCNTKRVIIFKIRPGYKPYESEITSFEYDRQIDWVTEFLRVVMEIVPARLKPLDETLVEIMHEAFRDLYPKLFQSFNSKLLEERFHNEYLSWLENQGKEFTPETNRLVIEQATYLQLTKLLFYGVIQSIYPEKLKPILIRDDENIQEALDMYYGEVQKIDYSPIYETDIISQISLTPAAEERIRTLIDTLNEFELSQIESDFIGKVYEDLIPPVERKRLGQFYTPQGIVDFITQLTIKSSEALILDPGCGSGSFLVKAYHRLKELKGAPSAKGLLSEKIHQQLLSQLYGVDINQFPAHLSVINLAIQNTKARIDKVNVVVKDFFDIRSGQDILSGFRAFTPSGEQSIIEFPPFFNVIIANPPYIRQELLGKKQKKKIKELIEEEFKNRIFVGHPQKKVKKSIIMDKQSDIYIYFFIHSIALLRNGGYVGFISSNKWLEVLYGEPFQEFLLEETKISFLVEFDRAVFPDLEVDTLVTILQKEEDVNVKSNNVVKFVRVKSFIPIEELISVISIKNENFEDDKIRIIVVKQNELIAGKWIIYLRGPSVLSKIVTNPIMKPLENVAKKVCFGTKTGYDGYFILPKEKVEEWGIEDEFLRPCAPAGEKIKGLVLNPEEITEYFFWVDKQKTKLNGTKAIKYIEYGEKLDVEPRARRKNTVRLPDVKSLRGRKFWYDIPKLELPSVFLPMWFRYKYRAILNGANAHGHSYWNYIITDPKDAEIMAALLNSSITQLLLEVFGRQYSGMLHIKIYELRKLPIPDLSQFDEEQRKKLTLAFLKLSGAIANRLKIEEKLKIPKINGNESKKKEKLEKIRKKEKLARNKLDEIVFEIIGLGKEERMLVYGALKELRRSRKMKTKGHQKKQI